MARRERGGFRNIVVSPTATQWFPVAHDTPLILECPPLVVIEPGTMAAGAQCPRTRRRDGRRAHSRLARTLQHRQSRPQAF